MTTDIKQTKSNILKYLGVGMLAVLAWSCTAQAWWNGEWTLRKKITIDVAAAGGVTDPVGSVPVLVRLFDSNFQFAQAKDDGGDLRFVAADDKTLLPFHIEKYDGLLNEAFVWVKIPDVKAGSKISFWLYYGNSGNKAVRSDDPKGTYDADTVLVYHFAEHGQPAVDSSGAGNNAKNAGMSSDGSMIGSGLRFDGQNPVTIPGSPSLAWTEGGALTWSAWVKASALQPNAEIFSRRNDTGAFVIGMDNGVPYVEVTNNGSAQRSPAAAPVTAGGWHHLAVVATGRRRRCILDGPFTRR